MIALDGVLGGRIVARAGDGHMSLHRAAVDDGAAGLRERRRQIPAQKKRRFESAVFSSCQR